MRLTLLLEQQVEESNGNIARFLKGNTCQKTYLNTDKMVERNSFPDDS